MSTNQDNQTIAPNAGYASVLSVLQKLFFDRVKKNENSQFSALDKNFEPMTFKWFSTRNIADELHTYPSLVRKILIKLETEKIVEKKKMFGCSNWCLKNIDGFKQSTAPDFYARSVKHSA